MEPGKAEWGKWGLIIFSALNTFKDIAEYIGKVHKELPPEWKQRLPGFLGLSLADEQIFNGVLGQLKVKDQVWITDFLFKKCRDFQRNRFVNIVAGMELEVGTPPGTKEHIWDAKNKISTDRSIPGTPDKDHRQEFLQKFADIIRLKGNDIAFEYAVGARLILEKSVNDSLQAKFGKTSGFIQESKMEVCDKINIVTDKLKEKSGGTYVGFWSANFPKEKQPQPAAPQMPAPAKGKYFWPIALTALTVGFVLFWPLSLVAVGISLLIYGFIVLGKHSWPISFAALVIGLMIYGVICS